MAAELAPGTWELEKSENFDEYMKALGVGMATRLIANKAKPKQEISISGDGTWTINTNTTLTKTSITFQLGAAFEETTADGRKVQTTCTVEGNTLVSQQAGEPPCIIKRVFDKDTFLMTLEVKGVVCNRYYKRAS